MVDWNNPKSKVSKYFTVHECTFLPSWGICHSPNETEKANLLKSAEKMDSIREFLGGPISIHCWIRPTVVNCQVSKYHGKNYNAEKGGAAKSWHISGLAVDWDLKGKSCDEVRDHLEPMLEKLNIRMERNPKSSWVHIDLAPVPKGGIRYFWP